MLADHGHLANDLLSPPALADIAWIEADPGDARREPANGWRVRTAIVVQDDDGLAAGVPEVVEGLVRHAPGEGAVADYGHHLAAACVGAVGLAGLPGGFETKVFGHRQAVGIRQSRARVAVFDPVVLRFCLARITGEATGLAEVVEPVLATSEELVDVGEMAGVPQDAVVRRIENPMQGQG